MTRVTPSYPKNVLGTLEGGIPSNSADLAALVRDKLDEIGSGIQGADENAWRLYWNEGKHREPLTPKHEESCRDALLSKLRSVLPDDIDIQPEALYAGDKRADMRITYKEFQVPVEIKKNSNRYLWSSLRSQLINQYTTDPATAGYGIYLVLWFDPSYTQLDPEGRRPRNRKTCDANWYRRYPGPRPARS